MLYYQVSSSNLCSYGFSKCVKGHENEICFRLLVQEIIIVVVVVVSVLKLWDTVPAKESKVCAA
jgi:hypothetical protein